MCILFLKEIPPEDIWSVPFFIRKAVPDDIQIILDLIIELAIYEKAPDAVKATPDILRRNLFEKQYAHAILAFSGSEDSPEEPIGLALYFFNFSTWTGRPGLFLEDLYVKERYRNAGVGKALFGELGIIAQSNDCGRVDWSVLTWNQPSINFYEKRLGAKQLTEWMGMRLEGDEIRNLDELVRKN